MKANAFAFPSQSRLTERGCFNRVFDKPTYTKRTAFYSVLACASNQPQARLGIVVAKRNVRLAVNRNKLKRFVRESFRQLQFHLHGLDVVVIVKKDFLLERLKVSNLAEVFKLMGEQHAAKTGHYPDSHVSCDVESNVLGGL